MNFRLTLLALFTFITLGTADSQTNMDGTIIHDGLTRTYRLYVPAKYKPSTPVPLVFNLHGYGSNNIQQEFYGDFRSIADTANFIIVLPNGTLDGNGSQFWNSFGTSTIDDIGFISDLLDTISADYNIDKNAVYSTGMSNGGFMSYVLACSLSNRIAAVASVAGTMVFNTINTCNPGHPVPVMHIHGTNDATVPYIGNIAFVPVDTVVKFWVQYNNCNINPAVTSVLDINKNDGSTATHYVYSGGDKESSVEFYKIEGGGHSWPGAIINLNVTNQDFNASKEIWRFFRKYKLNALTTNTQEQKEELETFKLFPNPSTNIFRVTFASFGKRTIIVTNYLGQEILNLESSEKDVELTIQHQGLYLLTVLEDNHIKSERLVKN